MPFGRNVGLATAGLVIVTMTIVFALSYRAMSARIIEDAHAGLQHNAAHIVTEIGQDLRSIVSTCSNLGRNTMLVNALLDSKARANYLEPFLKDFREVNGYPVEVALADFQGARIAGSYRLTWRDPSVAADVLQRGEMRAWLDDGDHGAAIVVAEPVRFFRTTSPEGALLYRISLPQIASQGRRRAHENELPEFPTASLITVASLDTNEARAIESHDAVTEGETIGSGDLAEFVIKRQVDAGELAPFIRIEVELAAPQSYLRAPLDNLLRGYAALGMAAIVLTVLVSASVGRHIARPLQQLESVATDIVGSGSLQHRFSVTGPREIVRLGNAFNSMLERLQGAQQRLSQMAQCDSLTGLANRAMFRVRLEEALAGANRTGMMFGLFLIDLDNFKQVNDGLGHPVGDLLLRTVAARLCESVRRTDIVARLGGDEFAIIAAHLKSVEDVETLARKLTRSFQPRFDLNGQYVVCTASIGVSVYACGAGDPEELLRQADIALYRAKAENRNCYRVFHSAMTLKESARKEAETLIRTLLATGAFVLKFQPKVALASGRVVGCEALLRCPSEHRNINIGEDLIPAAEASGLIVGLGEWVLREACAHARAWTDLGLPLVPVAVNVSAVQLREADFADMVAERLAEFSLPGSAIELEITESVVMDRSELVGQTLYRLRELGIRLSVDDFGTGYSSLTYLKRFPVQALKIDRSFVDGVTTSADDAAIARAVIALGRSLRLDVVAEGVESEEQVRFLREQGCQQAQGYFYSPPLSSDELAVWWRRQYADLHAPAQLKRAGTRS